MPELLAEALLALDLMPEEVRRLACNPTAGERYQWSYTAALSLIRYGYPFRLIEPLLVHYRGRPDNWAGELRAQIGNAANTILSGGGSNKPAIPAVAFTSTDADRVWSWLKEGRTLRALTALSPINPRLPAEEILRLLFPNDPYVCATLRSRDNQVKGLLSQYSSDFLRDCSFVVASTFATAGRREDDNVAERRFFVVELDITAEHPAWTAALAEATKAGLTVRDLCAAALLYISERFPLAMAVDSGPGGKSVHGWFFAPAIADHDEFCTIARKCGADRRITVPSQLWRMPWGTRRTKPEENKRAGKQPSLYLNPNYDR
jgi:hypothetical protein